MTWIFKPLGKYPPQDLRAMVGPVEILWVHREYDYSGVMYKIRNLITGQEMYVYPDEIVRSWAVY